MAENEEAIKRKSDEEVETIEPAPKRVRLESEDLKDLSKEEILEREDGMTDEEDGEGNVIPAPWRCDAMENSSWLDYHPQCSNNFSNETRALREEFMSYFNSEDGAVLWQWGMCGKQLNVCRIKESNEYIDHLEKKQNGEQANKELVGLMETGEKLKQQQQESTRRENVLVMRLATKEQEMQDLLTQIHDLKQAQNPSSIQLRSTLLDPAVNLLFQRMKTDLDSEKEKLEQAQNDLSAWKFTPDSVTGKKLMAKCRMLIQENQELGRQLSQGRVAQLEAELALQKKYSDELKGSQDELNDFVIQLDEEVEGMQSTILTLQHQLKDCKQQLSQSQEKLLVYEDKLKTSESLLADMRQQNSPVSLKSEEQEEHAPSQAQIQQAKVEVWTSGVESATGGEEGDRTSPASQSEESIEEERILLSAPAPLPVTSTVPTKPAVASAPSAFSISQLLSADSNLGKDKNEKNSLENGSSEHKIPPLEPCAEITESPLIAAMGVVERIGCDSNTFNGEVTG